MRQRNVRWGLCVSALLGLPAACGGGSDSGTPNAGGSGGSHAGAGAVAGAPHAGQPSNAGAAGEAHQAGAGGAAAGSVGAGAGGAAAGSVGAGAGGAAAGSVGAGAGGAAAGSAGAGAGGAAAGSAGAGAGGAAAGSAGANTGGGGTSSAGANTGGGGTSSAGANTGGGGQGGSAAGNGGAGGAAQIGCGSPTILDDMEDGNGAICPHPQRAGGWFVATSAGVSTTPAAGAMFPAYSLVNDPLGTSQYGMRLAGSGFSSVTLWAALGVSVSANAIYDASGYTSVRFWAKSHTGPLVVRFNLSTTETRSVTNGGTCTGTCDDSFGTFILLDSTWQQYVVTLALTTQAGWGTAATRNMAHLWTAEFNYTQKPYLQNVTNPSAFEFIVDDLQFN